MVLKSVLIKQMTEKIAFEVRLKNRKKRFPKKAFFDPFPSCWEQKKMYHMKFKSIIGYLSEKITILPNQMAAELAIEVDVFWSSSRTNNLLG